MFETKCDIIFDQIKSIDIIFLDRFILYWQLFAHTLIRYIYFQAFPSGHKTLNDNKYMAMMTKQLFMTCME